MEERDNQVAGCLHRCHKCGVAELQTLDDSGNLTLITKLCGECGILMMKQIIWAYSNIERGDSTQDFLKGGPNGLSA